MKIGIKSLLVVAVVTLVAAQLNAQTFTFDNAGTVTPGTRNYNPPPVGEAFDYGGFTPQLTQTSSYAAGVESTLSNIPGSGSVKLSWSFDASDGGEAAAFTFDVIPSPGNVYNNLSFDIMVGPGSTPDSFGGYGYFQVATRDGGYGYHDTGFNQELANPGYDPNNIAPGAGVWQHISIALSGADATVRGITIQDYADQSGSRIMTGPETLYIDNISLSPAVPEPASLALLGLAAPGLVFAARRYRNRKSA
jgi:hypothetical protein